MEDLPLGRIVAFLPEFAVKDLRLGRTLMMIVIVFALVALFYQTCDLTPVVNFGEFVGPVSQIHSPHLHADVSVSFQIF